MTRASVPGFSSVQLCQLDNARLRTSAHNRHSSGNLPLKASDVGILVRRVGADIGELHTGLVRPLVEHAAVELEPLSTVIVTSTSARVVWRSQRTDVTLDAHRDALVVEHISRCSCARRFDSAGSVRTIESRNRTKGL